MSLWLLLGIAVGLAMDAAAVAIATSIRLCRVSLGQTLRMSLAFGAFQALMPVLGWFAGRGLAGWVQNYDHWVAFALLAVVGGHMLWEAFSPAGADEPERDPTRGWTLWALAVATSIDALAVGLSFSFLHYPIAVPSAVIGVVAAVLTAASLQLGCRLGRVFGKRMDAFGGLVLIAIGAKILFDHLLK